MNISRLPVICIFSLLGVAGPTVAQNCWGSGLVGSPNRTLDRSIPNELYPVPGYEWRKYTTDEYHLYVDGKQIGGYRPSLDLYLALNASGAWVQEKPPISPPVGATVAQQVGDFKNYGIVLDQLNTEVTYSLNGVKGNKASIFEALADNKTLTDDTGRFHLTFVGTKEQCDQIKSDWSKDPAFGEWRSKIHFQAFELGSPLLEPRKLNSPGLYLQKADGTKLLRLDGYVNAARLAVDVANAVNPKLIPDLGIDLEKIPTWIWVILAIAGYALIQKPSKDK